MVVKTNSKRFSRNDVTTTVKICSSNLSEVVPKLQNYL